MTKMPLFRKKKEEKPEPEQVETEVQDETSKPQHAPQIVTEHAYLIHMIEQLGGMILELSQKVDALLEEAKK